MKDLWNRFWFGVRQTVKFQRSGYSESSPSDTPFVPEARVLNNKYQFSTVGQRLFPRHWIRGLATLWILEEMFDGTAPRAGLEILEPCCQDFVRLPALRSFFKNAKITGVEIDAYVPLEGFHSRWDHAQYYVSLANDGAQYVAADFFTYQSQADLILCFYPFVVPAPALAWGLPAEVASGKKWVESFVRNLRRGGQVLVVHQGAWEEEEFDRARCGSPLQIVARKALNCPFFPSKHPMHATLYRV